MTVERLFDRLADVFFTVQWPAPGTLRVPVMRALQSRGRKNLGDLFTAPVAREVFGVNCDSPANDWSNIKRRSM